MSTKTRAAVLSAAALTCGALAATPAVAAPSVHFLTKSQFPQGDRYENWHQTSIKKGLQDPSHLCLEQILPASRAQYRGFYTDLDAGGVQYVMKAKDKAAAKKLVTKIKARLPVCGDRWADEMPNGEFELVKYPHQDVEDGLSLRGVFTSGGGVEYGTALYGIGRGPLRDRHRARSDRQEVRRAHRGVHQDRPDRPEAAAGVAAATPRGRPASA